MPTPYYVSPEQLMKDKADYARKGIGRGKSVLVIEYSEGILFLAENTSATLHKISEIYDRIAFAGVGKFNEFEQLRIGGIRLSDLKGYSYSRHDVTAKALANAYSQTLGNIFTSEVKPYECEILVAAVGDDTNRNEIFHILYDGSVTDRQRWVAMGGQAETIEAHLGEHYPATYPEEVPDSEAALTLGIEALRAAGERELTPATVEAAVLDRNRSRRKFRRLSEQVLSKLF
ncbi:MAG: proteasome subunit alpha [Actinomycetota bacterium]